MTTKEKQLVTHYISVLTKTEGPVCVCGSCHIWGCTLWTQHQTEWEWQSINKAVLLSFNVGRLFYCVSALGGSAFSVRPIWAVVLLPGVNAGVCMCVCPCLCDVPTMLQGDNFAKCHPTQLVFSELLVNCKALTHSAHVDLHTLCCTLPLKVKVSPLSSLYHICHTLSLQVKVAWNILRLYISKFKWFFFWFFLKTL